jgi:putative transposase
LKHVVAELMLDNRALKEVLSKIKKLQAPAGLRAAASYVMVEYQVSERHACRLLGLARSTHRYRSRRPEQDAALRARLQGVGRGGACGSAIDG